MKSNLIAQSPLFLKRAEPCTAIYAVLLLLFTITLTQSTQAQQNGINISGKIVGAADKQPLPHINISIERKGVGTATNTAGLFVLRIPVENMNDTLKISCIGFKTKQLPVASLKNDENLTIVLESTSTELKEVKITYYDAEKILRKAIDRIPDNYINHPHVLRGFYRMYTFNDAQPLQLSEAVFDVYNYGYTDKHADLFRLIKARNEKNEVDFSMVEMGQKPNSVFAADVINHRSASGFLSDEGLTQHKFEVRGVVDIQGYEAYQIEFKEKPGAEGATFRGRMFIDTKTYAFIYFDFGLSPTGLSELGFGSFAAHALMGAKKVEMDLKQDHTTVGYQEVGHQWVLSSVSGDNVLSITPPEKKDVLLAKIKFNYQVTAVDTTVKASFNTRLDQQANINDHKSTADPKFWSDYNILLSDYDAEAVFKQLQDINQTNKTKDR
jgi:hypothetical protein